MAEKETLRLESSYKKKTRKRVNVWTQDDIQFRINQIEQELNDGKCNVSLSKARKKLLRSRLAKLQKARKGEILVGGQLAKKRHRIKKLRIHPSERKRKCRKECLCCRKKGHTLQECKFNTTKGQQDQQDTSTKLSYTKPICFNCGALSHTLKHCPIKVSKEGFLAFAYCFICSEKGHIAQTCSLNQTGIYPRGGSCHICQSQMHLMRDCPKRRLVDQSKQKSKVQGQGHKAIHVDHDDDNDTCWE